MKTPSPTEPIRTARPQRVDEFRSCSDRSGRKMQSQGWQKEKIEVRKANAAVWIGVVP